MRDETLLAAPLVVRSGDVIADRIFRYDPARFSTPNIQPVGFLRLDPGTKNVTIRNVKIIGLTDDQWRAQRYSSPGVVNNTKWWIWPLRGIAACDVTGLTIENVSIEGMPGQGVFTQDVSGLWVNGLTVERSWAALDFDWPRIRPNRDLLLERILGIDMRCCFDEPNLPRMGPSILDPRRWVGNNVISGIGADGLIVRDCWCVGENKGGIKVTDSRNVLFDRLRLPNLWLGGAGWNIPTLPYAGPTETKNWLVKNCVIGEGNWGSDANKTSDGNVVVGNYKVAEPIRVEDSIILAPRPGPLWAPWWKDAAGNPIPAPNFTRFHTVECNYDVQMSLKNIRIIDQYPDQPPPEIVASTGAVITQENVTIERMVQQWNAP